AARRISVRPPLSLHDALPILLVDAAFPTLRQRLSQSDFETARAPHDSALFACVGGRYDAKAQMEVRVDVDGTVNGTFRRVVHIRSEEHTSELQSRGHLVCRLL